MKKNLGQWTSGNFANDDWLHSLTHDCNQKRALSNSAETNFGFKMHLSHWRGAGQ